jgi:hypothetical protein
MEAELYGYPRCKPGSEIKYPKQKRLRLGAAPFRRQNAFLSTDEAALSGGVAVHMQLEWNAHCAKSIATLWLSIRQITFKKGKAGSNICNMSR